ncbi:GMP synthase (glutamine-hydrolyzing) [Malassezia sp. CBS 17886]|nr:GMP synthase (glutamine-hydrolyzing) [Malassezia sp. CBS 17886]
MTETNNETPPVHGQTGDIKRTLNIAVLETGQPSKPTMELVPGGYPVMFRNLLAEALSTIPRYEWHPKMSLFIRSFNVLQAEPPDVDELGEGKWDAVLVTGNLGSATEDAMWMDVMCKYLVHVATEHPLVRIIGIGFGHQIIARAFGGKVMKNPAGPELGVRPFDLTREGIEILTPLEPRSTWALEQLHEDCVSEMPPALNGELFSGLGSNAQTPIQGMVLRYPSEAPPMPSVVNTSSYIAFDVDDSVTGAAGPSPIRNAHIVTLQGHPEFTTGVTLAELEGAYAAGCIDDAALRDGRAHADKMQNGLETGRMLLGMLGIEPATADVPLDRAA